MYRVSQKFLAIGNLGYLQNMENCRRKIYCKSCVANLICWKLFCLGWAVMVLHSLNICSKKLRRCCQGDMMAKGGCVSRVEGDGSEGEMDATCHSNSEQNRSILMYSYRSNIAKWPAMAKCCTHMYMEHHKVLYIHYNKCSSWCPSCCSHMWIQHHSLGCTCHGVTRVVVAHTPWILSCSAALLQWSMHW
jgi:hypothetical protein